MTKQIKKIDIRKIENDYKPDETLFSEENEFIRRIKKIVLNELDEVDKRILLIYAEKGNQRETGKLLGVSAATINQKIKDIRQKIYDRL